MIVPVSRHLTSYLRWHINFFMEVVFQQEPKLSPGIDWFLTQDRFWWRWFVTSYRYLLLTSECFLQMGPTYDDMAAPIICVCIAHELLRQHCIVLLISCFALYMFLFCMAIWICQCFEEMFIHLHLVQFLALNMSLFSKGDAKIL